LLCIASRSTNLVRYAHAGEIDLRPLHASGAVGIEIDSRDEGPGIADLVAALGGGASTGGGLGVGLAGVRRLMDEFEVTSGPSGTRVICRKWRSTD
jgi:serine/threonine-protein kinase RsbT